MDAVSSVVENEIETLEFDSERTDSGFHDDGFRELMDRRRDTKVQAKQKNRRR